MARRDAQHNLPAELEAVIGDFVACGRCSFFLSGYRVIHGLDSLQAAIENQSGKWLELAWNQETRHLVQKSYGGRLDVELYHYDSRCPECQRRFIYQAATEEGEQESFKIELKRL